MTISHIYSFGRFMFSTFASCILICRYFKFIVNCMAFKMSVHLPSFISFNILFNILHPPSLFTCYTCLCFVVDVVNKSRLQYEGTLKYLGESVTGIKFRFRKKQQGSGVAVVTGDSSGDASRCADELWHFFCICTVVFLQKSRADDCDVIRWCHSDCSCYLSKGII